MCCHNVRMLAAYFHGKNPFYIDLKHDEYFKRFSHLDKEPARAQESEPCGFSYTAIKIRREHPRQSEAGILREYREQTMDA